MQTFDPRIYAVGECVAHRGIAYGLVAPLFEMAKVCANHLAQLRHRPLRGLADVDQAQGHRHRPLLRGRFRRRRRHRGDRARRSGRRRLQEARARRTTSSSARALRRHRRRRLVLQAAARGPQRRRRSATGSCSARRTSATPATRARTARAAMADDAEVCGCNGVCKGTIVKAIKEQGPVHARGRAQAHQGVVVVRLVHGPGRADPDGDGRRRLFRARRRRSRSAAAPTARTRKCATRSASRSCCRSRTRCAFLEWRTPNGCATCRPALNYYLHLDLAAGGAGRSAVALHQRARARQHPEGRHVLGRAAHVGRRDQCLRAAPHRRRRRQVRDPDGEGDRRPAHRPARREEGRTCPRCGATSTCRRATPTRRRCAR